MKSVSCALWCMANSGTVQTTGLEGKKFPVCIDPKSQRQLILFTVGPEVTFLVL